jgi:glycosyltransferase involved in cell wall biosynthesis
MTMKVALVHEFLITWGGSDLVVQKFGEIYPEAPIYTALFDKKQIGSRFEGKRIVTSFLQRAPLVLKKHRLFMPFFPIAFENFDLTAYDVVLSSHHMAAKSVITPATTCHISFVHTPMRYAWDYYPEYMAEFGRFMQIPMRLLFHYLRMHDVASANRVDYFIANSANVARRIKKHYRRDATVIHSPVQSKRFHLADKTGDFHLVVSRLVPYKRVDIAVEAFNKLGEKLVIAGSGPEMERLKSMARPNIEFLGFVPDEQLADYYARCRSFIFPGEEDFGITPLEAQASGRPVIAYASGGALETVSGGKTGVFFREQTPESLIAAVKDFSKIEFDPKAIRSHAETFDEEIFKRKIADFVEEKRTEWLEGNNGA